MCAADSIVVYSQFVSSLNFLGDRGCSDPRDKIYSLVSLSKPVQSKLTLDYTKSISEVCLDATRFIIRESRKLDVLCTSNYITINERQFITAHEAYRAVGQIFFL